MKSKQIIFSPEIAEALEQKKAVVALESTIISHGMPYPENRDTALLLEDMVRAQGAYPATIAILNGEIRVGLTNEEIQVLAEEDRSKILKVSTKDIPYLLVTKKHGACTVAATMYLAHKAGVSLFATGGIGGVHYGAERSFDVSADLTELGRTPLAVVCAGAKSILNLKLTLEYLETLAVPVLGYRTDTFPAFYTRSSGLPLELSLQSPEELALFLKEKWSLSADGGVVIANPIPEQYSLEESYVKSVVQEALHALERQGVEGKAVTPFLLSYIAEKTEKESLFSNIELVKNNARLAAETAVAFSKLNESWER